MPHRDMLETLEVSGQMPGHLPVKADGAVAGHGDDKRYFHLNAVAALLCLVDFN